MLDESRWPVNPAGFTVHAAIHDGMPDAHCVMHTHTTAGMAVACLQGGLQQTNFYTAQLHDMVAYHDFEGITVHADEGPRLLQSIGNRPAVILRNHGLLAWGQHAAAGLRDAVDPAARLRDPDGDLLRMGAGDSRSPKTSQRKCTRDALQFNPSTAAGRTCSTRWCGRSTASIRRIGTDR